MDPGDLTVELQAAAREMPEGVELPEPVTIRTIRDMVARGEPFAALTCYDATTAHWLQRAGVQILLVGDTAAEVILGYPRTIDMPLDVLIALTAGVKRGGPKAMVMADMPFMSYQADEASAIRNAGRFMTEGLADIVKVEADESFAPLVAKMARAGVPVCAHVGSRPQLAGLQGGYGASGRTAVDAQRIVRDAIALEQAGAVMILIEAVPDEVTREVVATTKAPLLGIGAGTECHGQVLVLQDLLGLTDTPPRFAEPVAVLGPVIQRAAAEWVVRVRTGRIGGRRYSMSRGEAEKMRSQGRPSGQPDRTTTGEKRT
jgi:3-methyl-2-oxobutanoate hydroxymethyltransferase